jgi:hypothetical protein
MRRRFYYRQLAAQAFSIVHNIINEYAIIARISSQMTNTENLAPEDIAHARVINNSLAVAALAKGALSIRVCGNSMAPVLFFNDLVTIRPATDIKVGAIVFCIPSLNGRTGYIHRVINIDGKTILTRGDHSNGFDPPISSNDVKGVLLPQDLPAVARILNTILKWLWIFLYNWPTPLCSSSRLRVRIWRKLAHFSPLLCPRKFFFRRAEISRFHIGAEREILLSLYRKCSTNLPGKRK